MLKLVTTAIFSIGLASAATVDTLAMQRYHEKLVEDRKGLRASSPNPEDLRSRLRVEPMEPEVLRDLSAFAPGGDDKLLILAERVSRQDTLTQLALLQSAAQSGDIDAALTHYDILLSTRQKITPVLQAQLANGLQSTEIAGKVEGYASRRWFPDFLAAASGMAADPRPVATLAGKTTQLSAADDRLVPLLLSALVSKGYPADAFLLAHTATRHDTAWTNFNLSPASLNPRLTPLTWTMTTGAQTHAAFDGTGTVSITVEPLTTARILKRVTDLAPGTYTLKQTVSATNMPAPSLEWRMNCLTAGSPKQAWRGRISSGDGPMGSSGDVTIMPGCTFQEWGLWAVGADTQIESVATIKDLSLRAL